MMSVTWFMVDKLGLQSTCKHICRHAFMQAVPGEAVSLAVRSVGPVTERLLDRIPELTR